MLTCASSPVKFKDSSKYKILPSLPPPVMIKLSFRTQIENIDPSWTFLTILEIVFVPVNKISWLQILFFYLNKILLFDFTSAPNNDVTVAITGKNITVLIKRHTGHVSRFFSAFENPHPFVQHTTIIERPKRQVSFPTGHDLVSFQRMPLRAYHRVHRALQLTIVVHWMDRFRFRTLTNQPCVFLSDRNYIYFLFFLRHIYDSGYR